MGDKLGRHSIEPRLSFSHARTKPLVVESVKRRIATPTALLCPSCGAKMRLVQPRGSSKLTASCPNCAQ